MTSQWNQKQKQWLRINWPVILARLKMVYHIFLSLSLSPLSGQITLLADTSFPVGKSQEGEWQTCHAVGTNNKTLMNVNKSKKTLHPFLFNEAIFALQRSLVTKLGRPIKFWHDCYFLFHLFCVTQKDMLSYFNLLRSPNRQTTNCEHLRQRAKISPI